MLLNEWNIWHNTTTSIFGIGNLHDIAHKLISSGLCKAVYHTDKVAYWKQGKQVESSEVIIGENIHGYGAIFDFTKKPDDYILEAIYQSASLHDYELNVFSDITVENLVYIRGFLDVCIISTDDHIINLYPIIKLYENGVIIITYRIISPKKEYDLDYLINNDLNLFKKDIKDIKLSPKIIMLDGKEFLLRDKVNFITRIKNIRKIKAVNNIIKLKSKKTQLNDYEFTLCSIDPLNIEEIPEFNIYNIKDYIVSSVIASISKQREGLPYILFGSKKSNYHKGDFWSNRPEVNILSFEEQPERADKIETKFRDELVKVLLRTSEIPRKCLKYLGDSLRVFNDMCIYVNEGIGLVIYSKEGLRKNEVWKDANRNHLYFPLQVRAEHANYIYMSYNNLLETLSLPLSELNLLSEIKSILSYYKYLINHVSIYGELNDYFRKVWDVLKLKEIESQILDNISIKIEKLKEKRDSRIIKFGFLLSIIFGLLGAVNIVNMVLLPIWSYYNLWLWIPIGEGLLTPFLYLATIIVIIAVLSIFYRIFLRRNPV